MKPDEILDYCLENLEGTVMVNSWGERGIYYNPKNKLTRGVYILTLKEKDGENDSSSNLDRENIFRVNMGVRKDTFRNIFGTIPKRPAKGGIIDMDYNFSATDQILPHPVYGWMCWICSLNPTRETFEALKPYIQEAYEYARQKYTKRMK